MTAYRATAIGRYVHSADLAETHALVHEYQAGHPILASEMLRVRVEFCRLVATALGWKKP